MADRETLMAALRGSAEQLPGGRWRWDELGFTHTEEEALDITEACLLLGEPVTDLMSSRKWLVLVRRVAALEEAARLA